MIRAVWKIGFLCAIITFFPHGIVVAWGEPAEPAETNTMKNVCDQFLDLQGCKELLKNRNEYPRVKDPILDGLNRLCDSPPAISWLWSDKEMACIDIRDGEKKFGKYGK